MAEQQIPIRGRKMPRKIVPVKRLPVAQPLDKPYRFIPLTQGQIAIVDAADFDWLNQWNWCAHNHPNGGFYAVRVDYSHGRKDFLYMHKVILNCECLGDHKNGNKLDNR